MPTEQLELFSKPGVYIPTIVVGILIALQYLKRLSVGIQKDSAEIDVIKLLRSQLKELAESNKQLQSELLATKELFRAANETLSQVKQENLELLQEVRSLRNTVQELESRLASSDNE